MTMKKRHWIILLKELELKNCYLINWQWLINRLPDDDGGHLIGSQFHGPGDIDNLVAQNSQINRSGGEWYNIWKMNGPTH